ncbi:MAG: hypothetical protein WAU53_06155 [Rhodoplanes sp.]
MLVLKASAAARIPGRFRAFSGEVGTGSPQKMRPLKDNQSEFRFHWNGIRFFRGGEVKSAAGQGLPPAAALALCD